MKTQKLTWAALLIAIATLTGHVFYIPVGASKCFPIQHTVNVLSAIMLGPWYALATAFVTSLLRNILGTGSLLAFPGSMFGALLAGLIYQRSGSQLLASLGEVFGTGILGAIACYPLIKLVMGQGRPSSLCSYDQYHWRHHNRQSTIKGLTSLNLVR